MKKHTIEVIAHRGVNRPGLENTLEGFAAAVQDGASAIECDVRLTRDHQPVVIHTSFGSDDVELILGVKESLTQLSWSELSDLRLRGSGFRVPHLADVLRFAESKDVRCYLEPKGKEKGLIDEIVRTVESRGRVGKDVILTFYRRGDFLESAKRLNPRMVTNAIVVSPFGAWRSIRYRGDQGVDSLTLGWRGVNHFRWLEMAGLNITQLVEQYHTAGLTIMGGYGDSRRDIEWLASRGFDGVFSNTVAVARATVDDIASR